MQREHKCLMCGCDLKVYGIHDCDSIYKFYPYNNDPDFEGNYHPQDIYEDGDCNSDTPNVFYCNKCNSMIGTANALQEYLNSILIPF